jgi:exodeoxyribonuclease VII small subunit
MADDQYTFTQARNRLQDIVVQVRKKDVSLEHSLDLLEEGVKLAAACTELIDSTEWRSVVDEFRAEESALESAAPSDDAPAPEVGLAAADHVEVADAEPPGHDGPAQGAS